MDRGPNDGTSANRSLPASHRGEPPDHALQHWIPPATVILPIMTRLTLVTPEDDGGDTNSLGPGIYGNMSSVFPDPF